MAASDPLPAHHPLPGSSPDIWRCPSGLQVQRHEHEVPSYSSHFFRPQYLAKSFDALAQVARHTTDASDVEGTKHNKENKDQFREANPKIAVHPGRA